MIDKVLRRPKDRVLTPIAQRVLQHISPTTITIVAFGVGIAAALVIAQGWYLVGLGLWIANRIGDGLDGMVARLYNKQSDLGGYLDIVLDTGIYAAIPLALAVSQHTTIGYLALACLISSFFINAASWMYLAAILEKRHNGAAAQGEDTTITMPDGLIEGTETIIFFSIFLLIPQAMVPLFGMMMLGVLVTAGQRILWAIRHI